MPVYLNQIPVGKRNGFVLPEYAERYRDDDSGIAKEIRRFLIKCGIQVHKEDTGKGTGTRAVVEVGFHSLRHSFASLCWQANAPLAVVEAIVGHSNPAMTRHYTHISEVAAAGAVAALPILLETPKLLMESNQPDIEVKEPAELLKEALKGLESLSAPSGKAGAAWTKEQARIVSLVRKAKELTDARPGHR